MHEAAVEAMQLGRERRGLRSRASRDKRPAIRLTAEQQALVSAHVGLVGVHLKRRVPTPSRPRRDRERADLFQEGCLALLEAAAQYHPRGDACFGAYALPRIRRAIYEALAERFSLIHIPKRARDAAAARKGRDPAAGEAVTFPKRETELDLGSVPAPSCPEPPHEDALARETVRHAIRRRYQRAIKLALEDLRARPWPLRNPATIMGRIAQERLLVTDEADRTPLRMIARDSGLSISRLSGYERLLNKAIRVRFAADPLLPTLIGFARDDEAGLDAPVDEARQEVLARQEVTAFARRFAALDRARQAAAVYDMIEASAMDAHEVASNLYRLTRACA